jgi:hypothetical protein
MMDRAGSRVQVYIYNSRRFAAGIVLYCIKKVPETYAWCLSLCTHGFLLDLSPDMIKAASYEAAG